MIFTPPSPETESVPGAEVAETMSTLGTNQFSCLLLNGLIGSEGTIPSPNSHSIILASVTSLK